MRKKKILWIAGVLFFSLWLFYLFAGIGWAAEEKETTKKKIKAAAIIFRFISINLF